MKRSPLHLLGPALVLLIFCGAVWLLYTQLTAKELQQIVDRLRDLVANKPLAIVLAVGLASFTAYTCGYNFSSTFAGSSVRYRLYSAWGVPTMKIVQLLVILALTFWFGLFALAGVVFIVTPLEMPPDLRCWWLPFSDTRPLGVILLSIALLYIGLSALHRGSVKLFRWTLPVPPFKLTVCQVLIASADLLLVAAVLYTLWPATEHSTYWNVLSIYMFMFVVGVLTHVPGGYGVMEAVLLTIIPDRAVRSDVIASWLLFRAIYYIGPLLVAAVLLGLYEIRLGLRSRRERAGGAGDASRPAAAGRESVEDPCSCDSR
jgi:uncharacterized membrane protein YbhN (UPF0104 family)